MAMSTKAELMEALFAIAARTLIDKLQSGEATAQDVKNAIQMLKDNGITSDEKAGPPGLMKELLSSLPFTDEVN